MFTSMKLAILTVLTTVGMEVQATPPGAACIFEYDRMMPRVTRELTPEQIKTVKAVVAELEGGLCADAILWADAMMDGLHLYKRD